MECSWIAPLTPAVMVISELTFQPLFCMVLISGSYFVCFLGEGSVRESIMAVCELDKLDCVVGRG
jgi:hypothetical protein